MHKNIYTLYTKGRPVGNVFFPRASEIGIDMLKLTAESSSDFTDSSPRLGCSERMRGEQGLFRAIDPDSPTSLRTQRIKRVFDLTLTIPIVLLGLPVFLLIGLAVWLTSTGPVLFRQQRSGKDGVPFEIFKFRTMRIDTDHLRLKHSLGSEDPRLTPIGGFLRRSCLDELPQFLNVLRGEMSIVGPRPLFRYDVEVLKRAAPAEFKKIQTIKPGITSIGQIHIGYATTEAELLRRLKYDLSYLDRYSIWRDLGLVLQTVAVMFLGRGK
jgi:lipopolysaccharide/colanic/teichoic acid biosynthesis glycosyltransferase